MAAFREQSARSKIFTDLRLDRSHLVSPSKSLILSCGEMDNTLKEKTLDKIVVVNLSRHYLKNLGSLSLCSALKICILSRNYITKIDALANCPNLIKLDLHGNHISTWQSELNHLRTLLSTINKILAHRSPVLIIQRWSRGFLTRRKLSAPDSHNDNYEQTKKPSVELCSRGIHVLEDGSVWVAGSRGMDDGRCNSVQLQIDKNKLQIDLLEDRCEANEITSGLYPPISQWKMENTPNLKPNKSNVFHPRTFRQPVFDPNSDRARLL
ncbi:uncharacterized protein LOC109921619 isoform X4 [Rhincodon typus]|uniref:uncharacterized protein LOC109921619 isoform X4 n=1 Tax=Rhincodon typus TaxID=259920 RepID=UPI002030F799|nr:uncharacterized protein LOC109921619 isoform X4 [Rhincodon typus]